MTAQAHDHEPGTRPEGPAGGVAAGEAVPVFGEDLFTEGAILDPYPRYAALRDLGPVVHLDAHGVYALTRYDVVRAALASPDVLVSSEGVGWNEATNHAAPESTLTTDAWLHEHLRSVVSRDLAPKSVRKQQPYVQGLADDLVTSLVARGSFDAVADLAQALPLTVVPDLMGWPAEARGRLVPFGAAVFDALGPAGDRCSAALPEFGQMFGYAAQMAEAGNLPPGSMGANILAAVDAGETTPSQGQAGLVDLLAPSLDTTISAIGSAIWLLGSNPDQWDLVRADPGLIPAAVNEVLRMETPIRMFTRVAREDWTFEGWTVPAGSRATVMYGSANRDERHYADPDAFRVTRNPTDHLGFGYGIHGCVGQGLARLEIQALLRALVQRVARFEVGEPTLQVNNLIRARAALPVVVHAA